MINLSCFLLHHLVDQLGVTQDEALESKLDEQVQVRSIDQTSHSQVRELATLTRSKLGASVSVVVDTHGHEERSGNHLRDLHEGDDPGGEPLGHGLDGLHVEVKVHDGVHGQVHRGEVMARTGLGHVAVPAEEQHSDVVVPMQENQRLLTQDDEHSVNELRKLGQAEGLHRQTSCAEAVQVLHRVTKSLLEGFG